MIDKLDATCEQYGMARNGKKTKTMIVHSKNRLVETTNTLVDMCLTKLLVKNNQS